MLETETLRKVRLLHPRVSIFVSHDRLFDWMLLIIIKNGMEQERRIKSTRYLNLSVGELNYIVEGMIVEIDIKGENINE